MTLKDELMELAEKVEAATGPDRELDARIEAMLAEADFEALAKEGVHVRDWKAPAYTSSFDADMALAPDMCGVEFRRFDDGNKWSCTLYGMVADGVSLAATKELAFCAAALRARASIKGSSHVDQ